MEDIRERQENEVIALKSIYLNNFDDLREAAATAAASVPSSPATKSSHSKKEQANSHLPWFKITLFPASSQSHDILSHEVYVQLDFKVKFTDEYPNQLPRMCFENEKGLSPESLKFLFRAVVNKAQTLKGNEMIYDLCQDIQDFLYQNNKPPGKSLYDQRLENYTKQQEQQQKETQACQEIICDESKKFEDQLLFEIDQAVEMKRKKLIEERKKEKELEKRERLLSGSPSNRLGRTLSSKSNSESERVDVIQQPLSPKSPTMQKITELFHPFIVELKSEQTQYKINCVNLLKEDKVNCLRVYQGVDVNINRIVTIYEYKFCIERGISFQQKMDICETEAKKMEEEFRVLSQLDNKLLTKYIAINSFKQGDSFIIQIGLEHEEGYTMEFFLNKSYAIMEQTLKTFILQLLDVLDFLHSNNLIHGELKPSSVHVINKKLDIKVSDYTIIRRINNLRELVVNEGENISTGSSKSDIYQLGVLVLSLSQGQEIKDSLIQVPPTLPPELKNFIIMTFKQLDRVDCKFLRTHPFILKTVATNTKIENSVMNIPKRTISFRYDDDENNCLESFTDYPLQSRLNTEFEVIGVIGQGGFGEVLKVKNKLDSRFYAIKRIQINPNDRQLKKQITREIKLLSRLNHENVVRYYSTWIEVYDESDARRDKKKSKSGHSDEASSTEQSKVKFRGDYDDTESANSRKNSRSSSSESSSSGSNVGRICWKKQHSEEGEGSPFGGSTDKNDEFSSFSSSDDDDDHVGNEVVDDDDEEDDQASTISSTTTSNSSLSTSPTDISHKMPAPSRLRDETDDSVIFADDDDATTTLPAAKKSTKSKEKTVKSTKKLTKTRKPSESFDSESEGGEEEFDEDGDGKKDYAGRQYIYIQMEYCGGKTLKDLIEKGLYKSEEKIWCLLREILQGLNHIHDKGMIHRDLKPGNVLIDANGHAKIGDFGLATSKIMMQKDNAAAAAAAAANNATTNPVPIGEANVGSDWSKTSIVNSSSQHYSSNNYYNTTDNSNPQQQMDTSGLVGTALYIAPELMNSKKNKLAYTQKVDIYSLGIMFYEMCFPFSTGMERHQVIQKLRYGDVSIPTDLPLESSYEKQIALIKLMLDHDPNKRPSAKDLLLNEMIPRKADEIALDELLKYSLNNKQSTNYTKILKALFDQETSKIEDASYDATHCKPISSLRVLQIREYAHNTLVRVFQKHGGYMINYPQLIPDSHLLDEYDKVYKMMDQSGLVLTLPYNHRVPFARYLARSGCTNLRRYHIGKVFNEKLKLISLHPREHVEASFDIVTTSSADAGVPELELLSVISDVLDSFSELNPTEQHYKLVINHSMILNAIYLYCGVTNEKHQKNINKILAELNTKIIKSFNVSKENKTNWLKDRLLALDNPVLSENTIERLLNFLLKFDQPEKILSELRTLTKSESHCSRIAREGLNQLKIIVSCLTMIGFNVEVILSCSYILPLISMPNGFDGFIFELLVRKKSKKNEYDILASGGRYDKLINQFRNKLSSHQYAVGVSFDFERMVFLINEKAKPISYRNELAVCSIIEPSSAIVTAGQIAPSTGIKLIRQTSQQKRIRAIDNGEQQSIGMNLNTLIVQDIKNRIRLYMQMSKLNNSLNMSTHLMHEKFPSIDDVDDFCRKNSIGSYAFMKEDSTPTTSQIFQSQTSSDYYNESSQPSTSIVKIRSLIERGHRFLEKNLGLSEFLQASNSIINNLSSFSSLNSSGLPSILPPVVESCFMFGPFVKSANASTPTSVSGPSSVNSFSSPSLTGSFSSRLNNLGNNSNSNPNLNATTNTSSVNSNYSEFLSALITNVNQSSKMASLNEPLNSSTSSIGTVSSSSGFSSNPSRASSANNSSTATSAFSGAYSHVNIIILNEARQQTGSGSSNNNPANRRKIELNILTKLKPVLSIFSSRTKIEILAMDINDHVLQILANGLHLEAPETQFNANWNQCIEKIGQNKQSRQLTNLGLKTVIHDLRYVHMFSVFILYNLKSEQFRLLVAH